MRIIIGIVFLGGVFFWRNLNCRVVLRSEEGERVAYLKEGIFKKKEELSWVTFPEETTAIGQDSFNGCISLEKIYFPNSIKKIGKNAFKFCSNLKTVVFSSDITHIGESAFEGCTDLNSIYLGEYLNKGLKSIGEKAFYNTGLETVELPYTTTQVGKLAFGECTNLREISLPKECLENNSIDLFLGDAYSEELKIFLGTIEIENLDGFINGVKYNISQDGHAYVERMLNKAEIANAIKVQNKIYNVEWIGEEACKNSDIDELRLPKYLFGIEKLAFKGCADLEKIEFSNNLKVISDEAFAECIKLLNPELPDSLIKIGRKAFSGVNKVEIPPNVELIEDSGLYGIEILKMPYELNINYMGNIFTEAGKCKLKELIIPHYWESSELLEKFDSELKKVNKVYY